MLPGLWRCGSNPLLDLTGILIHPVGLLLLLGAWGLLETFRKRRAAELVWGLFVVLGVEALVLVFLLLIMAALIHALGGNPTPAIEGGQYLGIFASWVAAWVVIRRTRNRWATEGQVSITPEARAYVPTVVDFVAVAGKLVLLFIIQAVPLLALAIVALMVIGLAAGPIAGLAAAGLVILGGVTALTLVHHRRRARQKPAADFASARRREVAPVPVAGSLFAIFGLVHLLTGPFFDRESYLSLPGIPYKVATLIYELNTPEISTDECLAHRAIELPSPPLFGKLLVRASHKARVRSVDSDGSQNFLGDVSHIWNPADSAGAELGRRGASASAGSVRVLNRVLRRGNHQEQQRAFWLLRTIAREHGAHPIITAWANSPDHPALHAAARTWLVCISKNRRDLIGKHVDAECNLPPTSEEIRLRKDEEREERWRRWLKGESPATAEETGSR